MSNEKYQPKNHIRIVTAASLFDGHDAAINIMRRIMQSTGAEVIHLGHNRSVKEIVICAVQEDVQAIAITSYQGGHTEFLKYMYDLLIENGAPHIKIFAGGGGTILPEEVKELENYGISKIYTPDDGRKMGLQGMINHLLKTSDFATGNLSKLNFDGIKNKEVNAIAQAISSCENNRQNIENEIVELKKIANKSNIPVVGITGTGGAGKSSLIDELVRRYLNSNPNKSIGIVSVDPSRRKTGGALLGDRIRMNAINHDNVYMRSLATRGANISVSPYVQDALNILKVANFDLIILETSGIGQSQTEITEHSDLSVYVMTPEFGAPSQLEKIDMLDFADIVVINKFDKFGADDALRDVSKQVLRNREVFDKMPDQMPVYGTVASQFNDDGVNVFFSKLVESINLLDKRKFLLPNYDGITKHETTYIVPPERRRYLSEIADVIRNYNKDVQLKKETGHKLYSLYNVIQFYRKGENPVVREELQKQYDNNCDSLDKETKNIITGWDKKIQSFKDEFFVYKVRDKEIKVENYVETLSHSKIPKIAVPKFKDWGQQIEWSMQENFPGFFPFTAGVFPFKREGEDPTRMFAGEGGPERTNKRFHYVSSGMPAVRLSTAFDSVTLYGEDPAVRPDIYGKIGNSGVSISSLDDAKRLYSGFKLSDVKTSVSMTINGPAPIMTAYFFNAAIDQECEIYIKQNGLENEIKAKIAQIYAEKGLEQPKYRAELPRGHNGLGLFMLGISGDKVLPADVYQKIKEKTLSSVRGTVQADILKEDQAQNTCIYSIDFSLKLMGDMQAYFIKNMVRNFYSVSISGYHIAEAGANPITQLALTLANGFTYVEYYLARGMNIDDFAPNLSFFFSNGLDPEYSVIGRVARRIWAKAIKIKYRGNERSQKLKYHIQTSGRSLHSQEIDFNDIRTSLQAVYAIFDNCNSLHTNAYDEAITTPTEESVRRALAIQLIINKEYGLAKNQNPLQGAFIIEELTDLVEEAVMIEFDSITSRGGVLGAMETMYQRNKIQQESMYYEHKKMSGEMPIIGVNTFLSSTGSEIQVPNEVIRATEQEKQHQLNSLKEYHQVWVYESEEAIKHLKQVAESHGNVFEALMEVSKYCSLGQISNALYEVGGQYRRNM
ncbi:MAG: methylmalonyl-CoA mutase family protein [Bacteroidales bacterium]|nr:methylmalonyl-CoA mutase family protein [Bacteroidales bacterium]